MTSTRRAPRSLTLTMIGHAAVWHLEQAEALAARPANATAPGACCETVYRTEALKPLESDYVYSKASEVVSFERDDLVCKFCREDFAADFGEEPADVYHIYDRGHDPRD